MSMYITFIELSLLSHNVKGKLHTLSNVINPSDKQAYLSILDNL